MTQPPATDAIRHGRIASSSEVALVWYRILGPLEVQIDGESVPLGPPKQRAVLAVLLLHGGETVSTATLEESLWGDDPPRTASQSMQTYVSGLRRILGDAAIITTAHGYRLSLDGSELDARSFEQLATTVGRHMSDGRTAEAFDAAGQALGLWRGEPLSDVDLASVMAGAIRRLVELRLQTAERWAAAALMLGRPDEVHAELERLTLENPLRESLWMVRMRALSASGRTADALGVYQDLSRGLAETLGLEPSAEAKDLEEAILLGEPTALPSRPEPGNPFKGLRPFTEADSADFFGRDHLVRELLEAIDDPGWRMIAVVGPSGSGKSSVVRAGAVPAVRQGALSGEWDIVVTQPGRRPSEDLLAAVTASLDLEYDPPASLETICDQLQRRRRRLLVVLDQFEELFTSVDEAEASRFMHQLAANTGHPALRLVVTLRADYYDRPLLHPEFGRHFAAGVIHVHPLSTDELAQAASGPARRVGVALEPALVSELLSDVSDSPGALPLFQYALTEMFDRRQADTLTLNTYRAIGGASGALTMRADDVYRRLGEPAQVAARQVLLRMVAVGEGGRITRRRVSMDELRSLDIDPEALDDVLDRFGHYRLLSFDRDATSGAATAEVAHEALLEAWPLLASWIEEARSDLRRRASLATARNEWEDAKRDLGYLLTSTRLDQYEAWAKETSLDLTSSEREFLAFSIEARDSRLEAERRAAALERHGRRRAVLRTWALATVPVLVIAAAAAFPYIGGDAPRLAALIPGGGDRGISDLVGVGVAEAERRYGVEITRVEPLVAPTESITRLCDSGVDLFLVSFDWFDYVPFVLEECEAAKVFAIDAFVDRATAEDEDFAYSTFNAREGSFLAGAAAASETSTGVVGFVGVRLALIEEFLVGFEDGVAAVDSDVEVRVVWLDSFAQPTVGRAAGAALVAAGADVIYHAAGASGDGVLEAVTVANQTSEHPIWFIGVDVDEALTAPPASRPYVLTSMVKRVDTAVLDAVGFYLTNDWTHGEVTYGLANDGVGLATTGGHIDDIVPDLDRLKQAAVNGESLPRGTSTELTLNQDATHFGAITFTDGTCSYSGPVALDQGDVLQVNGTADVDAWGLMVVQVESGTAFTGAPVSGNDIPPEIRADTATSIGGQAREHSLVVPAFAGTWWLGCMLSDTLLPAAAIEVAPAPSS